ncbi:hypothetical protein R1sor_015794 [Riccia sorocarpa]|uniref:Uncharacterized protein n=1 Tax=Riccia sorocarpa TaxID=122646 RepID=A0ABD3HGL4_9MARC
MSDNQQMSEVVTNYDIADDSDTGDGDSSEEANTAEDDTNRRRTKDPGGKFLIPFDEIADREHDLRWGFFQYEFVRKTVTQIDDDQFQVLGLQTTLSINFPQPNVAVCKQFISNYNKNRKAGVVNGRQFTLSVQIVRQALNLQEGQRVQRQIKHAKIQDWFPIRDDKGHRYFANDCIHENWRGMFQLLNALLLARRRVKDVHGRLAITVKNHVQGIQKQDWAQLIVDSLSLKICFLKKQMLRNRRPRTFLTFVGQILTWLFMHAGLIPVQHGPEHPQSPPPDTFTFFIF